MKKEKQLLLDEIKEQIVNYDAFLILNYLAIKANKLGEFRGVVAKAGGNVEIGRKRMLIKAAEAAGVKLNLEDLPGHIGLVLSGKDALETMKSVLKFSEENDNLLNVIGAYFDGETYGAEDVKKLATLPGKNEMRAELLSVLEAPLSQTLAVMDALLTSVVYCLDNKSKEDK
jgi:large subunit ribosomal protein L10